MDEIEMKEDEILNRVVNDLEAGKHCSDEELAALMQDEGAMQAARELLDCKRAVMRRYDTDAPDVEDEWQKFRKRTGKAMPAPTSSLPSASPRKPYRFLWGAVTGVAASFLLVLLYTWWGGGLSKQNIVVFQATDSVQQVVLQTSVGDRIALSPNTKEETLKVVDASLGKKDTLALTYQDEVPAADETVETHTVTTPRGKDFKVQLADGTVVWMNAESRLEYPSRFSGKERVVHLHGEAYFKVAKDASHPFIVYAGDVQARVLGTELNIRNYKALDSHITLINGQVEVADSRRPEASITLQPGQDAHWTGDGRFDVKAVDTDAYIYWRDGYFYFDDCPLVDVMQELGRWYNINVVFERENLMQLHVRYFCVRSETLARAIELLRHMKINTELRGNTVYVK